ncbi:glycosyltransferase [Aliiglaciecola sp. LCG003]|uniref:glycosyltransferase n=1 Tax=Aliiglaciecola sp. LCG003 TaxID=3053655 RepID=UPI002572C727|nr:glycosyltransferase [Aliiglaciecola sp. LCG003]WJG10464.1 glycosyltransferase [Aliiglaciecola sp. LCG003]
MTNNLNPKPPIVSVVMACYREPLDWFGAAVDSILAQTLADFEFIIVLDDPNNLSIREYLYQKQLSDGRIVIIENASNLGLAKSLMKGIEQSTGAFIARMDADDVAYQERLKVQYQFLLANQQVGLVGSAIENIDELGNVLGKQYFQSDYALMKKMIPYCSVACHPTWMFTKQAYDKIKGYRNLSTAQDYDFLYRLIDAEIEIHNLPVALLQYRIHNASITSGMSLKRYKIRRYIHKLHHDRVRQGHDHFCEQELQHFIDQASPNKLVSKLLTQLRQSEQSNSPMKYVILPCLAILSNDIRQRITDHLKLKLLLAKHTKSQDLS